MKDAKHLDAREVAPQERTVLGDRVLAQMPRVIGLLGAGRGERQPVRRRDVGQRRGGREALQQTARLVDVLDRLQEDDRVARPLELLHQTTLEAQVSKPVAQPGVLVGLRVCVHPHHLGGCPR